MILIGICGASGSGKSTLASSLQEKLGEETCLVLQQDAYYLDHPGLSFPERCALNYDEPGIFDHDLLLEDIRSLENGKSISRKRYDFSHHCRMDATKERIEPRDVVILEGIHCFYDQRLLNKMFLRLYVQVDPDICLLRRIQRDLVERGRDINSVSMQYMSTVRPMYEQYIRHYVKDADVIVANGGKGARIVDILYGYVRDAMHSGGTDQ